MTLSPTALLGDAPRVEKSSVASARRNVNTALDTLIAVSCAAMRERIACLEEEVEQLRALIGGNAEAAMRWRLLGLGDVKARMFDILMRRPIASHAALVMCMRDSANPKSLHVHISKMRLALRPLGIRINNLKSDGYSLEVADKRRALAIVDGLSPALVPEEVVEVAP